jgi:hypothetical protein
MVERRRRKMELEHQAYMTRRFGEWPKRIPTVVAEPQSEWRQLDLRPGWRGDQVAIKVRDTDTTDTGVEYGVFVDGKPSLMSGEETEAWLYFASLTIT